MENGLNGKIQKHVLTTTSCFYLGVVRRHFQAMVRGPGTITRALGPAVLTIMSPNRASDVVLYGSNRLKSIVPRGAMCPGY